MTSRLTELVRDATRGRSANFAAVRPQGFEIVGTSRQGREIPAVHCGEETAGPVCVVVAGLHAEELTGVAGAVEVIRRLGRAPISGSRLFVVPAVDVDGVADNLSKIEGDDPMVSLLGLAPGRDMEGEFCTGNHLEAAALRRRLEGFDRIDAYLSLHATNHLVPGGFCYAGGRDPEAVGTVGTLIGARMAGCGLPRLNSDPTGMGGARVTEGVFGIPHVEGSSIDFVERRFDPSILTVTEFPLGLVEPHGPIALEKLDVWRRSTRRGGRGARDDITSFVEPQIELLHQVVADVLRAVAVVES